MANPFRLKLLAAPLFALVLSLSACSTAADTTPIEHLAGIAVSSGTSE